MAKFLKGEGLSHLWYKVKEFSTGLFSYSGMRDYLPKITLTDGGQDGITWTVEDNIITVHGNDTVTTSDIWLTIFDGEIKDLQKVSAKNYLNIVFEQSSYADISPLSTKIKYTRYYKRNDQEQSSTGTYTVTRTDVSVPFKYSYLPSYSSSYEQHDHCKIEILIKATTPSAFSGTCTIAASIIPKKYRDVIETVSDLSIFNSYSVTNMIIDKEITDLENNISTNYTTLDSAKMNINGNNAESLVSMPATDTLSITSDVIDDSWVDAEVGFLLDSGLEYDTANVNLTRQSSYTGAGTIAVTPKAIDTTYHSMNVGDQPIRHFGFRLPQKVGATAWQVGTRYAGKAGIQFCDFTNEYLLSNSSHMFESVHRPYRNNTYFGYNGEDNIYVDIPDPIDGMSKYSTSSPYVTLNDEIHTINGINHYCWKYGDSTWTLLDEPCPYNTQAAVLISFNNKLHLFGGTTINGVDHGKDHYTWSKKEGWIKKADSPNYCNMYCQTSIFVWGNELFEIGAQYNITQYDYIRWFKKYNEKTDTWSSVSAPVKDENGNTAYSVINREPTTVVIDDTKLLVFPTGMYANSYDSEDQSKQYVEIIRTNTSTCTATLKTATIPFGGSIIFDTRPSGSILLIIYGQGKFSGYSNQVWRFYLSTGVCERIRYVYNDSSSIDYWIYSNHNIGRYSYIKFYVRYYPTKETIESIKTNYFKSNFNGIFATSQIHDLTLKSYLENSSRTLTDIENVYKLEDVKLGDLSWDFYSSASGTPDVPDPVMPVSGIRNDREYYRVERVNSIYETDNSGEVNILCTRYDPQDDTSPWIYFIEFPFAFFSKVAIVANGTMYGGNYLWVSLFGHDPSIEDDTDTMYRPPGFGKEFTVYVKSHLKNPTTKKTTLLTEMTNGRKLIGAKADQPDNAIIIGDNNIAKSNGQIIMGQYADPKEDDAFVVGNGSGPDFLSNLFSVDTRGNFRTKGGMIWAQGELQGVLLANSPYWFDLEDGAGYIIFLNAKVNNSTYRGCHVYFMWAPWDHRDAGAQTTAGGAGRGTWIALGSNGTVGYSLGFYGKSYIHTDPGTGTTYTRYHTVVGIGSCATNIWCRFSIIKVMGSMEDFPK